MKKKLFDSYSREISYLRISVTDRCNLRCLYCNPAGEMKPSFCDDILRFEEIIRIIEIMAARGLKKVRITGGEPLVRKGITSFIANLKKIDGIEDIGLTTNGVYLKRYAKVLYQAGLDRINVSLDSLKPHKFAEITGMNLFSQVWDGIQEAESIGFSPIKLNVVIQKGFNDNEIGDIVKLTIDKPFHVRFIEYMPVKHCRMDWKDKFISSSDVRDKIESIYDKLIPCITSHLSGPANNFKIKGAKGVVGFISAISKHFCDTCNRVRLTSSGKMKHCLFSKGYIDFREPLRDGTNNNDLNKLIDEVMLTKPKNHNMYPGSKEKKYIGSMVGIGG